MEKGDRVRLVNHAEVEFETSLGGSPDEHPCYLGTIIKRSPVGYTQVEWDSNHALPDWLSPDTAARILQVVTGEDAKPRHDWVELERDDWRCSRCDVVQSDKNYWEVCTRDS